MRGHRHGDVHGHGHHRHPHGHGHRSPFGHLVKHRLQRRLFWWFGGNILVTGITVALVMKLMSDGGANEWRRMFDGGRRFVSRQFEKVWDDPAARTALANELSSDVGVQVVLRDASGAQSFATGACEGRTVSGEVVRDGARVGGVELCAGRRAHHAPWRFILPLVIALGMLWAASGRLARRLGKPLGELAKVATELGAGNLKARVTLDPKDRGEVVVVAEAVNEMAARIEKQVSDQRELLAAVSHELRTPLQRVRLITEIARGGALSEKTLDQLDQEVIELDALVGDLLATSRLDFGQLSPKPMDAKDVAVRALERAGLSPDAFEGRALSFEADATLMARALANLLENARRHGGGAKVLRVRQEKDNVVFEVDDGGPGFSNAEADKAFDPFFRRPRTMDAEAASLGLGLALVKRIAEAHRGWAFAGNRPQGGARVGFGVPLKRAAQNEHDVVIR